MAEQPKVAKRKTHTKSRKGCFQCKQRHTKCNEVRPRCGNCVRLDVNCTFPTISNGYTSSTQQQSPADVNFPFPHDASSPPAPDRGIFELSIPDMRLLHHWTAIGYKACTPNFSSRTDSWGVALVELGFDYPFLLRGFLALSAVHKASFLVQSERPPLLLQADAHISQALEDMRRNLEAPSYEKSIPMFVLSSILLTYNFGSVQEMPEDPVGSLHHCFMLLNGIKLITNPFWDKLQHVPVLLPLVEMSLPDLLGRFTTAAKDDTNPEILKLLDLTHLLLNADEKADCTAAINELHWIAVIMPYVPNEYDSHPLLFLWAARASMRFFDLLAVHNPVACIITVHFAALLAQTRSTWWYVKWPRYLLSATEKLLQSAPDLLKWLEWPRGVIYNAAPPSVGATPSSAAT